MNHKYPAAYTQTYFTHSLVLPGEYIHVWGYFLFIHTKGRVNYFTNKSSVRIDHSSVQTWICVHAISTSYKQFDLCDRCNHQTGRLVCKSAWRNLNPATRNAPLPIPRHFKSRWYTFPNVSLQWILVVSKGHTLAWRSIRPLVKCLWWPMVGMSKRPEQRQTRRLLCVRWSHASDERMDGRRAVQGCDFGLHGVAHQFAQILVAVYGRVLVSHQYSALQALTIEHTCWSLLQRHQTPCRHTRPTPRIHRGACTAAADTYSSLWRETLSEQMYTNAYEHFHSASHDRITNGILRFNNYGGIYTQSL